MSENSFSLEEIRPLDVMDRFWGLRRADLQSVIDERTRSIRKDIAVDRVCPGCGNSRRELAFHKDGFDFYNCGACTLLYVTPVLNLSSLAQWYRTASGTKLFESQVLTRSTDVRTRKIFRPRLEGLAEFLPNKGKLLDVGCSRGDFLVLARQMGWQVHGVDIDPNLAALAAQRAECQTWAAPVEEADVPVGFFDLVTLWEVLEHLSQPNVMLEKILRILRPGGVLALTTPNCEGIEFEAVGPDHVTFLPPEHINFYAPSTLTSVLTRLGFEIVKIATPGQLDLDNVLDAIRTSGTRGIGDRFLLRLSKAPRFAEVREKIIDIVQAARISGNMEIIARKPVSP